MSTPRPAGPLARALIAAALLGAPATYAQDGAAPAPFDWLEGPAVGQLGDQATIQVPEGYVFLARRDTQRLLEMMENPVSGKELGTLAPASDEESWWLFFDFDEMGYVPDDDQDDLDADDLFEALVEGNEYGNEERRKRGWAEYELVRWETEPHYEATTQNLEWGIRGRVAGVDNLNHDIRILGRQGVMIVTLVGDVEECTRAMPRVRALLEGFAFDEGRRYGDYVKGDRIAEATLVTLVTGGAAVWALKTGFFKKFGKVLIAAVVALGAFLKKLFGRKG